MPLPAVVSGFDQARRRTAYAVVAGLAGLAATASPAPAQSPGGAEAHQRPAKATPPAGQPAPRSSAPAATGVPAGRAPRIGRVRCRTRCAGVTSARSGSMLDLRGRAIAAVEAVIFLGDPGEQDDITVAARKVTRKRILVSVPRFARSGPLAVVDANGAESPPTRAPLTIGASERSGPSAGAPAIDVQVQSPKVFFDARREATLSYVVSSAGATTVDVDLVRVADGVAIARWSPGLVQPGTPQSVSWDGTAGGRVQPAGRYEFRVTARDGSGAKATTAQAPAATGRPEPDTFEFLDHQFPVRGRHDYGGYAASFGGGRGHQGQDVFAVCGTPLVAARGGRVKFRQYHSAAGNYVVIDGEQTGEDYAYMHLRDPSPVKEGARVRTGQLIGYVGETGRASGCHLHFELWSAPGWYDGGAPFDPLPRLRQWDAAS